MEWDANPNYSKGQGNLQTAVCGVKYFNEKLLGQVPSFRWRLFQGLFSLAIQLLFKWSYYHFHHLHSNEFSYEDIFLLFHLQLKYKYHYSSL